MQRKAQDGLGVEAAATADDLARQAPFLDAPALDIARAEDEGGALIDEAQINTLTVVIMEVPCCRGLLQLALDAADCRPAPGWIRLPTSRPRPSAKVDITMK